MKTQVNKHSHGSGRLKPLSVVLADAFKEDPVMSSIFRNQREIEHFMLFMLKYFEKVGEIHYTTDGHGVALWLRPGVSFLSLSILFSQGLTREILQLVFSVSPGSLRRLFRISDYLSSRKPATDHYYLFVIGISSSAKGQGIGKRLMQYAIERFGHEHQYYLENTNVINNSFYQKFGFRLKSEGEYRGKTFYFMAKPKQFGPSYLNINGSEKTTETSASWFTGVQPKRETEPVF